MRSSNNRKVGAVVVCAGKGSRAGLGYNKILHCVGNKTVLERTLDAFVGKAQSVVVVISAQDEARIAELVSAYPDVKLCYGGATRFDSVYNGLRALENCDIALIHDGARPYVSPTVIDECIRSAKLRGSGSAAVPAVDTVKIVSGDRIVNELDRDKLVNVQTPQAFYYKDILSAYERAISNGKTDYTDDSAVYAAAGNTPTVVYGDYGNIKITSQTDLFRFAPQGARIGTGFDVHRLVEGRKLILGGVHIPFNLGLLGHSDADVLTHAVMDALLSAAGLPDIGVLFPDDSAETDGISSMKLLENVLDRLDESNLRISSVSAVVIAQKPKLAGHIDIIKRSLACAMRMNEPNVNVSATTTEHLGIIGKGEAIAASAVCLLNVKSS